MISSRLRIRSECQGLPTWLAVVLLSIAVNSISTVANAQRLPFLQIITGHCLGDDDHATTDEVIVQVLTVNNENDAEAGPGVAPRKDESTKKEPRAAGNSAMDGPRAEKAKAKKEKRGEIIIAPLPISSPAIGTGIIPVLGYIFPMDKNDKIPPPSVIGGAGLITNKGSRTLALGGNLYLKRGGYQVTSIYVHGHLNYNFYGTGTIAGNAGRKLAITQSGQIFFGEALRRIGRKFYLGPRARVAHSAITPNLEKSDRDHPNIPEPYLNTNVKAFGARLLRDSRPNRFYPTAGTLFDFRSNFFYVSPNAGIVSITTGSSQSLKGNDFSFQSYRLTFNKYDSLSNRQVLAYNLFVCAVNGKAPFYGQCIFGTNNELCGYVAGRYIDRRMFATQVEYRLDLPKRFGVAAFGGIGEVAPTVSKFNFDNLLPAIGGGLRYNLSKEYHVNLRFDIAQGKNAYTWSMGVGEAF